VHSIFVRQVALKMSAAPSVAELLASIEFSVTEAVKLAAPGGGRSGRKDATRILAEAANALTSITHGSAGLTASEIEHVRDLLGHVRRLQADPAAPLQGGTSLQSATAPAAALPQDLGVVAVSPSPRVHAPARPAASTVSSVASVSSSAIGGAGAVPPTRSGSSSADSVSGSVPPTAGSAGLPMTAASTQPPGGASHACRARPGAAVDRAGG